MRIGELNHSELLDLDPGGATLRFAGRRTMMLDAAAMGQLRRVLVDRFDQPAARSVLTELGFAHGWRLASALQKALVWDSDEEWQLALGRAAALEGLFLVERGQSLLDRDGAQVNDSWEAEQHKRHLGASARPVCWTACAVASGYLSRSTGTDVCVLEDRCVASGASACHFVARTRIGWGTEREAELFAQPAALFVAAMAAAARPDPSKVGRDGKRVASPVTEQPAGMIAWGEPMRHLMELARRVAKVDATVLVTGESGSGKERIARLIHDSSSRAEGPFIGVNCGAITETLLESELFGHVRGAFTGAMHDRVGLFEAASGGTLLLDEVGDVPPAMQVKLLRALQEREIRRVGESRPRPIDVRIVAATNRDLMAEVAAGRFRQDLYYRLKVVELPVPALRHRHEDLLPLARALLSDSAQRMQRDIDGLTPKAAEQLLRYAWPGNVRELENAMERAVALARGNRIELEDLPDEVRNVIAQAPVSSGEVRPLDHVERDYILAALAANDGNQTRTAAQLHIGAATLYRKLKKYRAISSIEAG